MMKILISVGLIFLFSPTLAVGQVDIYANPTNLQVLPEDISSNDLRETMKSFALSTGFRCSSCHMGEENQPMTEYDFASDDRELKEKARLMMKMVNSINGTHLASLSDDRVEVKCVTCHRGVTKPELTGDVLANAADEGGVEKLKESYGALRERYYGSHSYDFTDMTLADFARSRAAAGKPEEAYAMLDMVLDDSPDSFMAHFSYAEIYHRAGNAPLVIEHYKQAIEANPRAAGFLQPRIEQLESAEE
jgi:tetratricopeptide (TPR) repeat protein